MFRSRLYARRFDDAFAIAHRLLDMFPSSPPASANVGVAYVSRCQYDEGWQSCPSSMSSDLGAPAYPVLMLALAAHMRGDEVAADRFASRPVAGR